MAEKIENNLTEQLCEAILSLKDKREISNFLEDVCTISEYRALAQRFEVARLLDEGVKYEEIVARTGASTATISRVKRCLVYGKDGYSTALANLNAGRHGDRSPRVQRKVQFEKERAEIKRQMHERAGKEQ
ncbi:MAG: YerC/YecD family TrpR-related protein [Succiniclasticum sp.]|jgi:TrpR-related protein YerC/YecD|nr:YerC/YecD family TrpR-related protein [Succiniclasticum sp.]MEE3478812.1 YerC/YecD family TrpR-related protein [Succiniclasticum sp.]